MLQSVWTRLSALVLITAGLMNPASAWGQASPAQSEGPEVVVRGMLPDRDTVSRTVYIGDLNLATDQGVKEMEKRVANAVDWICEIPGAIAYYGRAAEKPCRDEGWAGARVQMDRAVQAARDSTGSR